MKNKQNLKNENAKSNSIKNENNKSKANSNIENNITKNAEKMENKNFGNKEENPKNTQKSVKNNEKTAKKSLKSTNFSNFSDKKEKSSSNLNKIDQNISSQENAKKENISQKSSSKNETKSKKNGRSKTQRMALLSLAVTTAILGVTTTGLAVGYGITQSQANSYSTQLENVYKKSYYDLVDNVNSADMKLSKLLATPSSHNYSAKMLTQLSQTAKEMQSNVASLPLSSDGILESVRFINQMSGYTDVLDEKLSNGGVLTTYDREVLSEMHDSLTEMKRFLNQMSLNMMNGYSILQSSEIQDGEFSKFSVEFGQLRSDDADFPTMIYDGPFSDSVVNQEIKGLSGSEVSRDDAYKKVDEVFKNVANIKYQGLTDGKFSTYNFSMLNSDNQKLFVQVSKIGGNILTVSGNVSSNAKNIDYDRAEKIAVDFAKTNDIENPTVVWSEQLDSQAYFNIAPTQNGVILYPDLVKVKIDLDHADVAGYDAVSYWTNHTNRTLGDVTISLQEAKAKIDSGFDLKNERLVLSPLDYNREVLCYEFEAEKDGSTYYFYVNANTDVVENVLKVVKTTDSSKLM